MKVHGGKDFAKLQKAFIILSQTFWLTLLYRRVDVSVARCGFHEIGKKTLDSSYSEILRTIDVLVLDHSTVGDFNLCPGFCGHSHLALENNGRAKIDITRHLKAV